VLQATAAGRGVRNAFRNAVRTVSVVVILGLAIGLCCVMLIARHSVSGQVAATLGSVGNTVTITPPLLSAGGQPVKNLTTAELAPIAHLSGVASIDETLNSTSARTSLRPAGAGPAVYFSGSTQPANPLNIGASTLQIVSGHAIPGTTSADVAMISTAMAQENGLKIGSAFTAYGKTLTVAAIFDSGNQSGNDTIITPLPVLERLSGESGQVSTAVVTVASLTGLAAATAAIERTLGPHASVTSDLAGASQAIGDLDSVTGIALYSLAGSAGAAVVILFLVMVMIVRERKREIGILKAIGAPDGRIMAQFTAEALTFTLLGLAVGLAGGILAGSAVTTALVSHSGASSAAGAAGLPGAASPFVSRLTDVSAQVGWAVILEALAGAVVVAVLATAATTWMIARIRPAEVLRSE
jgi:putative ABC transport system permease protein